MEKSMPPMTWVHRNLSVRMAYSIPAPKALKGAAMHG